eukprot:TRINITY_DN51552_c0_g1_i1.p2 TRINITY_DN51552_c0_g1~~TRINITY_DN51552_c0_g1_i1.p2  ORF type:complete len:113 (+),score=11.58 TRINITY_DN51552_c0_g1_i1:127-465(+)
MHTYFGCEFQCVFIQRIVQDVFVFDKQGLLGRSLLWKQGHTLQIGVWGYRNCHCLSIVCEQGLDALMNLCFVYYIVRFALQIKKKKKKKKKKKYQEEAECQDKERMDQRGNE